MKKVLLGLLVILMIQMVMTILNGCYRPHWYKRDMTPTQFRNDSYDCKMSLFPMSRSERIIEFEKCMTKKGYVILY